MPDDPKVHARENTIFHEHIYRAAHNRFLLKSLQDLHDSVVLLGRTTFAAPGRIAEALGEHQAIVVAIARRDDAEAEELMRRHVRRGYELRLSAMAEAARAGSQNRIDQPKSRRADKHTDIRQRSKTRQSRAITGKQLMMRKAIADMFAPHSSCRPRRNSWRWARWRLSVRRR